MSARDEWLSERELAQEHGIPERTPAQWRYRGVGPKYVKIGRHVRYRRADVDTWIAEHTIDPSSRFAA
jgi:predicted DNA-binding transcriptional regulator AlpA